MSSNSTRACLLACAVFLIGGCAEPAADPLMPAFAVKPGDPGAASDRVLYQVRLGATDPFRAQGVVLLEIVGGYLTVTVHAAGLDPNARIPQHIHVNPTCNPGGGVLVNLDANLTVPTEGPGVGAAYPLSNQAGVVNYYASRSLTDLLAAVNTYQGAGLASVDALLTWLNLDNRNVHMHVSSGPPFHVVNCGELERIN
ncbi:MAG: hypothetical protein WEE89_01460 [Gemmatimonadota bacterium]